MNDNEGECVNLHFEVLPRNLHFEAYRVLCLPRNLHCEVHYVLCLPRNLHCEVHKVLRLPRNLHLEVHKVLCLARNLHLKVHKLLCLPRNLHFEVKPLRSLAPVTKSRLWTTKTRGFPHACHEKCAKMRTAPQRELSRDKHIQPPRLCEPSRNPCRRFREA